MTPQALTLDATTPHRRRGCATHTNGWVSALLRAWRRRRTAADSATSRNAVYIGL